MGCPVPFSVLGSVRGSREVARKNVYCPTNSVGDSSPGSMGTVPRSMTGEEPVDETFLRSTTEGGWGGDAPNHRSCLILERTVYETSDILEVR